MTITSMEATLSLILLGFGVVGLSIATSPGNRSSNPYAGLGIAFSAIAAGVGFVLCISFVVAARGIWKDRAYGATVAISLNAIGVFLSFSQVTQSPLALSIVVVGGVGIAAGCIAYRSPPRNEDVSHQ